MESTLNRNANKISIKMRYFTLHFYEFIFNLFIIKYYIFHFQKVKKNHTVAKYSFQFWNKLLRCCSKKFKKDQIRKKL